VVPETASQATGRQGDGEDHKDAHLIVPQFLCLPTLKRRDAAARCMIYQKKPGVLLQRHSKLTRQKRARLDGRAF
jgi:hypothetical protein